MEDLGNLLNVKNLFLPKSLSALTPLSRHGQTINASARSIKTHPHHLLTLLCGLCGKTDNLTRNESHEGKN